MAVSYPRERSEAWKSRRMRAARPMRPAFQHLADAAAGKKENLVQVRVVPDIQIEETRISFRAVATDLVSGEQIIFSEGSLRQAVMASCAVPGAIAPLKEGERLLSDGGIICLVPSSVARQEGADIVISVAVDRCIGSEELRTVVDIYHRVSEIMGEKLKNYELADADVVILPEVGDLHWSNFSQAMNLIDEGEKAASEKLDDIRSVMPGIKKWFRFKKIQKSHKKRE